MNIHKNARLTPYRRGDLVTRAARGEPVAELASQFGVSLRTARKWRGLCNIEKQSCIDALIDMLNDR